MSFVKLENIPPTAPILGFTGVLGSGCTFLARNVSKECRYVYAGLSESLHTILKERGEPETYQNLQNLGNELRRSHGQDFLALKAITKADGIWPTQEFSGVILDGFRNTAEIEPFRQLPNFFLVAVHASEERREERLREAGRCQNHTEFEHTAKRDSEERDPYGQQVSQCYQWADIILQNDTDISVNVPTEVVRFVNSKIRDKYVALVERRAHGEPTFDFYPSLDESMMTLAYALSASSHCLKRSVGAVISDGKGTVISSGYNDVPPGLKACAERGGNRWCNRDMRLQEMGQHLQVCPKCGRDIAYHIECNQCDEIVDRYARYCPNCRAELTVDYSCPQCGLKVFSQFFPKMLEVCRSLHAEEMAILNLARNGVKLPPDAVMYVTTYPCNLCANKIVTAGIKKVVYSESYESADAKEVFKDRVTVLPFEGVKNTAYFRFYS